MGLSAYDVENYLGDVGSNSGWSQFAKWAATQGGALEQVANDGWTEDIELLKLQLSKARLKDPSNESVRQALVDAAAKAKEIFLVTDGVGATDVGKGDDKPATVSTPTLLTPQEPSEVLQADSRVPEVLRLALAEVVPMPPDGESGLPASLEKDVPPEYRYWLLKGDEARAVRDALVDARLFTDETVQIVDGEPRRLMVKRFLPMFDEAPVEDVEFVKSEGRGNLLAKLAPSSILTVRADDLDDAFDLMPPDTAFHVVAREPADVAVVVEKLSSREGVQKPYPNEHAARVADPGDFVEGSMRSTEVAPGIRLIVGRKEPNGPMAAQAYRFDRTRFSASEAEAWLKEHDVTPTKFEEASEKGIPWIVETRFTPEGVAALEKAGTPFVLNSVQNGGAAFAASFALPLGDAVLLVKEVLTEPLDNALQVRRVVKGANAEDERYVLGVVLEPETVDAQNDIYSKEEVRSAAHKYMERFQNTGLMHHADVSGTVKVLESYIAPTDFQVGDEKVKKGSWIMAVRVNDDELWKAVKSGELTGFSIGGSAVRRREERGD